MTKPVVLLFSTTAAKNELPRTGLSDKIILIVPESTYICHLPAFAKGQFFVQPHFLFFVSASKVH
jgi:hypothetical protein